VNFKRFNEIAELVGIVAIVASLVFVGMQLRQSQLIALAEAEGVFAIASIEMASLIGDNSEVWKKGIANEKLDAIEGPVFESIVAALSDRAWSTQNQFRLLGDDANAESVVHEFAAFLHARPGARRVWTEREEELERIRRALDPETLEFTSVFIVTIKEDLATLDQNVN
jgi:hypothetical protein